MTDHAHRMEAVELLDLAQAHFEDRSMPRAMYLLALAQVHATLAVIAPIEACQGPVKEHDPLAAVELSDLYAQVEQLTLDLELCQQELKAAKDYIVKTKRESGAEDSQTGNAALAQVRVLSEQLRDDLHRLAGGDDDGPIRL